MTTKYYTSTLLSDVVLNSSLATEGNISSLDYIPGSNFLGIVAGQLYGQNGIGNDDAYELFHNGKVKFGDATISKNNLLSFSMPFSFFIDKIEKEIGTDSVYLHHLIKNENRPTRKDKKTLAQLKQIREGYLLSDFHVVKEVEKSFSLKSAQDRETRNSKEGAMFGFDAMQKGQVFVFSIQYDDEAFITLIEGALTGLRRLGKSKNAEYGQVEINHLDVQINDPSFLAKNFVLVYAQSNLYLTDEVTGQATLQPSAEQLGISTGNINWELSQVRSFSYSPWNGQRKTSSTQRHCIARGSVFYIENATKPKYDEAFVGGFQAEGLGKILYNPFFLEGLDGESNLLKNELSIFEKTTENKRTIKNDITTKLSRFLQMKLKEKQKELAIFQKVVLTIESLKSDKSSLIEISSSQWGGIRSYATNEKDYKKLDSSLFETEKGYLRHGIAEEKYWGKKGNLKKFKNIFEENKDLGNTFIAKFAAEMAKENKRHEKNKDNGKK